MIDHGGISLNTFGPISAGLAVWRLRINQSTNGTKKNDSEYTVSKPSCTTYLTGPWHSDFPGRGGESGEDICEIESARVEVVSRA